MKLQYLGDSKDSFKWDYHDYLVGMLGYEILNVVSMLTPDDGTSQGSSKSTLFPARREIIKFCSDLRATRDIRLVRHLPCAASSNCSVVLHSHRLFPDIDNRLCYFDGFSSKPEQVLLIDPDNGFEPQRSFSNKHLRYSELDHVLRQISPTSVISVFQHFRRKMRIPVNVNSYSGSW